MKDKDYDRLWAVVERWVLEGTTEYVGATYLIHEFRVDKDTANQVIEDFAEANPHLVEEPEYDQFGNLRIRVRAFDKILKRFKPANNF